MSQVKDMTEMTAPAYSDILYAVDDPAGTPADRKVTIQTLRAGVYNVREYGAVGDGATDDTAALAAAEAAADDAGGVLYFPAGDYELTADWTVSANVALAFAPGATLSLATTKTLTLQSPGRIGADPSQRIFVLAGTATLAFVEGGEISANWFGLSPSASAPNNATYMNQALAIGFANTCDVAIYGSAANPIPCGAVAYANASGDPIAGIKIRGVGRPHFDHSSLTGTERAWSITGTAADMIRYHFLLENIEIYGPEEDSGCWLAVKMISSIDTGTDIITMAAAHGWDDDQPVRLLRNSTLPTGLLENTTYYVLLPVQAVASIDTGTNVITMGAAHGWIATTPVQIRSSGTLPAPLAVDTVYYVISPSGADLKLSLTEGGAEIDLTTVGSGTIELWKATELQLSATEGGGAIDITGAGAADMGLHAAAATSGFGVRLEYILHAKLVDVEVKYFANGYYVETSYTEWERVHAWGCFNGLRLANDCTLGSYVACKFDTNFNNVSLTGTVHNQTFLGCLFQSAGNNAITLAPGTGENIYAIEIINPYFEVCARHAIALCQTTGWADVAGGVRGIGISEGTWSTITGSPIYGSITNDGDVHGVQVRNCLALTGPASISGYLRNSSVATSSDGGTGGVASAVWYYDELGAVHFGIPTVAAHSFANGHADWSMTATEAGASLFTVTLADAPADAEFPVVMPGKQFKVYNNSGQAITFKVSGQAGAATTNGKYSVWVMNATDCVLIYEQP